MSATLLTKSEYARRCGVSPGAVGNWIARGKLTRPAIRRDGRINPVLADLQLGTRGAGRPDAAADNIMTGGDSYVIGAVIAPDQLPGLAQALRLDRGQVSALNRWFAGRRTA